METLTDPITAPRLAPVETVNFPSGPVTPMANGPFSGISVTVAPASGFPLNVTTPSTGASFGPLEDEHPMNRQTATERQLRKLIVTEKSFFAIEAAKKMKRSGSSDSLLPDF